MLKVCKDVHYVFSGCAAAALNVHGSKQHYLGRTNVSSLIFFLNSAGYKIWHQFPENTQELLSPYLHTK